MFQRSLASLSLAATIVVAGTPSSYGQTQFYRESIEKGAKELPNNPAV